MHMTFWFLEDSRWYTMLGKGKGLKVKFQFCHIPVMYIWTSYLSSFGSRCRNNLSVDWQMRGLRNYGIYIGLTKKFMWFFHILVNLMYTMKYYSALKKKGNLAICNNVNEPARHYSNQNKPDRKKLHNLTIYGIWSSWYMGVKNRMVVNRGGKVWGVGRCWSKVQSCSYVV